MFRRRGVRSAAARGVAREPRGRPPLGTRTTRRVDGSERRAPERNIKGLRGYIKLSDAVKFFNVDFTDKTVLDIGSSTGGFTKYALDHGAKKVIAVEKGTNQMASPLRLDPHIELYEKTDIFDFKPKEEIDIILADVSFLSLKPILKYLSFLKSADFLVMLKPQFEAKPEDKINGIIKNEKIRRNIIKNFETWLKQNQFIILKKRDNELKGRNGNQERFYYLKLAK